MGKKKEVELNKPKGGFISRLEIMPLLMGLAIGFLLGFLITSPKKAKVVKQPEVENTLSEIRTGGYKFTNPLLDCDNFNPSVLKAHVDLINSLNDYVKNALLNEDATQISVYFRSLNNGPWIGINEKEYYTPASLLKLPILIATLKKAENDPALLKMHINYNTPYDTIYKPNIKDTTCIRLGKAYSVDELLRFMIVHSDNEAKEILVHLISNDYIMNVMEELGVNLKNRNFSIDFISVKEYSSFYRILYNASYLNRNMSEKALELLSQTNYNKGITNKLPKDLVVSHKFGERGFENSDLKQLHDCGIIYLPGNPYLLCVMSRGYDFDKLSKVISDISLMVYNNVKKGYN